LAPHLSLLYLVIVWLTLTLPLAMKTRHITTLMRVLFHKNLMASLAVRGLTFWSSSLSSCNLRRKPLNFHKDGKSTQRGNLIMKFIQIVLLAATHMKQDIF